MAAILKPSVAIVVLLIVCLVNLKTSERESEHLIHGVGEIDVKSNTTLEPPMGPFPNGSNATAMGAISTTLSPKPNDTTKTTTDRCCYNSKVDLLEKFTREFVEDQIALDKHGIWNGDEYEEWIKYSYQSPFGQVLNDLNTPMCEFQWQRLVLAEQTGWRLAEQLHHIMHKTGGTANVGFRYVEDDPSKKRVLLLGDSISQGTWIKTQTFFSHLANIHSAPTNCGGFKQYDQRLDQWLGSCNWDLIHWNIGMHFPVPDADEDILRNNDTINAQDLAVMSRLEEYKEGLLMVIRRLKEHSPHATLAFSLTTPSPLDAIEKEDLPDPASCPHYNLFHPKGYVSILNKVAVEVCEEHNITLIDRYSAVLPSLGQYQKPCDIHFLEEGYEHLALADWEKISGLL